MKQIILWMAVFAFALLLPAQVSRHQPSVSSQTTMIGRIDEKPGDRYVLVEDQEMRVIADLVPDGFTPDALAKYVGEKVEVKGKIVSDSPRVLKVRSIKALTSGQ